MWWAFLEVLNRTYPSHWSEASERGGPWRLTSADLSTRGLRTRPHGPPRWGPFRLCRERAAPRLLCLPPGGQDSGLLGSLSKVSQRHHVESSPTLAAFSRAFSSGSRSRWFSGPSAPGGGPRTDPVSAAFISGHAVSFSSLSLPPSLSSLLPSSLSCLFFQPEIRSRGPPWSPWPNCPGCGGNMLRKCAAARLRVWRCPEASGSSPRGYRRQSLPLAVSFWAARSPGRQGFHSPWPPAAAWGLLGAEDPLRLLGPPLPGPRWPHGCFSGASEAGCLRTSRLLVSVHLKTMHRISEPSEAFALVKSQQKPAPVATLLFREPAPGTVILSSRRLWEAHLRPERSPGKSLPHWTQFYRLLLLLPSPPTPPWCCHFPPSSCNYCFLSPSSSDLVMRSITGCRSWFPS